MEFSNNYQRASLVAQTVKSLPAMQETQVRSLGQEDPLEKDMATHSSILAWKKQLPTLSIFARACLPLVHLWRTVSLDLLAIF